MACAVVPAALLGTAGGAYAVPVVTDGFETTTHPAGNRTVAVPPGAPFFTRFDPAAASGSTGSAAIVNDATLGSNALAVTSTGSGTSFPVVATLPAPVTIANVGDRVTLSFTFRYTNNATATASTNNFRFGLFNSNGTPVTGDNQAASDNDVGYYTAIGSGGTAPATNSIFFDEGGGTQPLLGGTDRTNITASGNSGTGINDNNAHTAIFSVTRTGASAVQLSLTLDGAVTPITGTDTAAPFRTTFDEVAFSSGFQTAGLAFNLDNVVVDFVPEPGAAGLLAVGAAGLLARRRRPA